MKRIAFVQVSLVNGTRTPTVPAAATSWICIHDFGNRMLVKMQLPDGTAPTANTIADITIDQDGRQLDITAEPLTSAQRTTIRNFLQSNGIDVSRFDGDGIDDRAKLLRFLLRRAAGWRDINWRDLLDGWDA